MIVTAIDSGFLPGLKALVNSIRCHSPDTPVACFTYGDESLKKEAHKICDSVIHNKSVADYLPPGDGTEQGCHPMYARLIAPVHFGRCIWLDADQIVQTNMNQLLDKQFEEPVAAVRHPASTQHSVVGLKTHSFPGIYSGLMVFNDTVWNERRLTERCFEIMQNKDAFFRFVVQSVLNIALEGDFHELPTIWQGFANRKWITPQNFRVLHWHGRGPKPWTHPEMPNASVWRKYA